MFTRNLVTSRRWHIFIQYTRVSPHSSSEICSQHSWLIIYLERVEIQKYFDLFVTRGFFPKITLPTRPSRYNASLIDQLFCKLNNPKQHLISCIIQTQISDHYPYFSLIDILKKKHHRPKFVKINSMNADSLNMFCNDIKDSMKNTTCFMTLMIITGYLKNS